MSHTWEIKNPQFSTLSPGVNLHNMLVSMVNSYSDRLPLEILDMQIINKEKVQTRTTDSRDSLNKL